MPGLHQLPWDKAGSRGDGCLPQLLGWPKLSPFFPQPCSQGSSCMLKAELKTALTSHQLQVITFLAALAALFAFKCSWRLCKSAAFQGVLYPSSSFTFKPQGRGAVGARV